MSHVESGYGWELKAEVSREEEDAGVIVLLSAESTDQVGVTDRNKWQLGERMLFTPKAAVSLATQLLDAVALQEAALSETPPTPLRRV